MVDVFVKAQKQIRRTINTAVAQATREASKAVLEDIKGHVQVRSGRLINSYSVRQNVTANKATATISSSVEYRDEQYPYKTVFANPFNNIFNDPPALFAKDNNERDAAVRSKVVSELKRRF